MTPLVALGLLLTLSHPPPTPPSPAKKWVEKIFQCAEEQNSAYLDRCIRKHAALDGDPRRRAELLKLRPMTKLKFFTQLLQVGKHSC